MTNVRQRVITLVVLLTLLATSTASGISFLYIYNTFKISTEESLRDSAISYAHELNGVVVSIEVAVDTFSKSIQALIDPNRLKEPDYYESFDLILEQMAQEFDTNSVNATSFYVRFNPKFSSGTSGVFHADTNGDGRLETLEPTDLSKYDPTDRERVGWFYEPIESKKPIWMKPYYNANIKTYMVSYIKPLFINGETIGVIGIDIDFKRLKDITLKRSGVGKVIIMDQNFNFLVHDVYKMEDQLDQIDGGRLKGLQRQMQSQTIGIANYQLENIPKVLGFSRLKNDWTVAVAMTKEEAFTAFNRTVLLLIGINILVLLAMCVIAVLVGRYLNTLLMRNADLEKEVATRTTQLIETNDYLEETVAELESQQAELLELNNQLEEAYEKLKEMQERLIVNEKLAALGELVAGVAHEINTPIGTAITVNSYMVKELEQLEMLYTSGNMKKQNLETCMEANREAQGIIGKSLNQVAELIELFKQMTMDRKLLDVRRVSLCKTLEHVQALFKDELAFGEHHINLTCETTFEVLTYPIVMDQILKQLISNSLIHGFEGLKGKLIEIEVKQINKEVQLIYRDNGRGIPENELDKVFNPFYSTRKNRGSVGLGLHLVHNLVTQTLNGTITLSNLPTEGIQIVLTFPELAI